MNRIHKVAGAALLVPAFALAAGSFNSNHPEEAYPDNMPPMTSAGPYTDFIKQVQEKLHERGFDAGPINGDFGTKTQAALAQFQLSQTLPASGMLDDETLKELGVQRQSQALAADDSDKQEGGTAEAGANSNSDAGSSAGGSSAPRTD